MRVLTPAFLWLFCANLLQATASMLFLHLPGRMQQLGASEALVGIIMALGAGTAIAASPLIGRILDRGSDSWLVESALAMAAALSLALGQQQSLNLTAGLLFLALQALMAFLFTAMFLRAIELLSPELRARGLALFSIASMGAVGLASVLGELLLQWQDYEGLFSAMTLLYLLAALPLSLERLRSSSSKARHRAATLPVADSTETPVAGYFASISDHSLWPVWCLCTGFFAAMVSVFVFVKLTTASTGVGSVGLYFGVYAGVAVALRVLAGGLPERFALLNFTFVILTIYAIGFGVLAGARTELAFIAAAVLGGIGHGFGYPLLLTLASTRGRASNQGSTVATFNAIDEGMTLLAAPALGWVLGVGGPALLYITAAAIVATGTGLAALLVTREGGRS